LSPSDKTTTLGPAKSAQLESAMQHVPQFSLDGQTPSR
jgi:hypothetical protein